MLPEGATASASGTTSCGSPPTRASRSGDAATIHRRVGDALERRFAGRELDEAALLSLHFHEAGAHEKACRYATVAADRAADGFANVDAAGLYERALDAAERVDAVPEAERARLAEALGDVCERFADYARSAAAYERAIAVSDGRRPTSRASGGRSPRSRSAAAGTTTRSPATTRRSTSSTPTRPPCETRAGLELGRAGVLYRQARYEECVTWAGRAATNAEAAGDRAALAHALYLTGSALAELGRDGIDGGAARSRDL